MKGESRVLSQHCWKMIATAFAAQVFFVPERCFKRYSRTPSKILPYICIPEARFVGVIVTW